MAQSATIAEALRLATEELRQASVPDPQLAAQSLLAEALGCDRTYLIVNFRETLTEQILGQYGELVARRAKGEPLQYITGRQEFFGLSFEVTPDVLIPRPETELIVEEVIRLAHQTEADDHNSHWLIVDVGTGSGCIAVTLAREIGQAQVVATDISPAALRVARRNATRYQLATRVGFVAADLLDVFSEGVSADFITCNPPYITAHEWLTLQREVRDWEPQIALTDGADGLGFYRRLLKDAPARLKAGGHLICEMGYSQDQLIADLIDPDVWNSQHTIADLQSIPRVLVLQRK